VNIQWIKGLEWLQKTGNFSQSAEISNLSQSAFSRRIKGIEDWVGVPLVDRSRHPVSLTTAGEQLLEAGLQALLRIENEREQIRRLHSSPDAYVVRFAAQHSIGWRFYPNWLQAFEEKFGPILSRLRADNLPNCLDDLRRGEVDFVMSYETGKTAGLGDDQPIEWVTIGRDRLIPVCRSEPDGTPKYRVDGDAMAMIPYLRFDDSAPIGQHVAPLIEKRGLGSRLSVIYENAMSGALRVRARDGLGVAWLPESLVDPDLEAGNLAWAGGDDLAVEVEIRLHRKSGNRNLLVQRIWTFLKLRERVPLSP
jgi:DNA-binding transcriptional LysR family regulator